MKMTEGRLQSRWGRVNLLEGLLSFQQGEAMSKSP